MGGRGSKSSAMTADAQKQSKAPYYAPKELSSSEVKSYSDSKLKSVYEEQYNEFSKADDIRHSSKIRVQQLNNYFKRPASQRDMSQEQKLRMERKRRVRSQKVATVKQNVFGKNLATLEAQMNKRNIANHSLFE